jgi:hypothetical protein
MNSTARKYKVKTMHFLKKSGVKIGDFLKEHYKAILVLALVNIRINQRHALNYPIPITKRYHLWRF